MAKGQKDKRPKVAEEEPRDSTPEAPAKEDASLAVREEEADDVAADGDGEPRGAVVPGDTSDTSDASDAEDGETEGEGDVAAAQLGTDRYVMAGFFASAMLLAFILGRLIHGVWSTIANKDWFNRTLPALAAVGDDDKTTYGMVIGGIIALVVVLRTYRNPEIRTWCDEVAAELAKVKWPTKKDVTNSTLVVITATAVATLYLALLDRFWAFVTGIVYGDGS